MFMNFSSYIIPHFTLQLEKKTEIKKGKKKEKSDYGTGKIYRLPRRR